MAPLAVTLTALCCASLMIAQSAVANVVQSTGTCLKRSAMLYTSGRSTYMVSEYATTSNLAAPTNYGCNATVTLPQATTTIFLGNGSSATCAMPTSSSGAGPSLIADGGFEDGSVQPFNISASSTGITARIVQGGPMVPASGSNYLLITYEPPADGSKHRRQTASAPSMSSYNLTNTFPATSGNTYVISANAEEAANGGVAVQCFVQICADGACGPQTALTTSYQLYSYTFIAGSETEATAVLVFMCSGPAYVGVDNVAAVAVGSGATAPTSPSPLPPTTQTVVSYITTTVEITATQGVPQCSPVATETVSTTLASPSSHAVFRNVTNNQYFTRTTTAAGQNVTNDHYVTATVYSTAVQTETALASSITLTTTAITTSTSTTTVDLTATEFSTLYSTSLILSTTFATETSVSYVTATELQTSTETTYLVSTQTTTQIVTTTTLSISSQAPDTIVSTNDHTVLSTLFTTVATTTTYTQSASTITFTPLPQTTTLDASTVTFSLAPVTTTLNLVSTQLATETDYFTSYQTGTITSVEISTESDTTTLYQTNTASLTLTYPASTVTQSVTETDDYTSYETDTATITTSAIATSTEICFASPSPLSGGDFNDLSSWSQQVSPYGSLTVESSGGDPGSYVEAYCNGAPNGPYDNDVLRQTLNTCPGEVYDFSLAYNMLEAEINNYLNIFANGQYIVSVGSNGNALDSMGNSYDQWNTISGTYTASSNITLIEVYFTCTNFQEMYFGLDSFFWSAEGAPVQPSSTVFPTTTTTTTTTAPSSTNAYIACGTHDACDMAYSCPNAGAAGESCLCHQTANGGSACVTNDNCNASCATDADCGAGAVCGNTCCGLTCFPYDNTCANPAAGARLFKAARKRDTMMTGTYYKPGYMKVEGLAHLVPIGEA